MICNALHTHMNYFCRIMWCPTIMCSTLNQGKLVAKFQNNKAKLERRKSVTAHVIHLSLSLSVSLHPRLIQFSRHCSRKKKN